jgi:hypothetical protein
VLRNFLYLDVDLVLEFIGQLEGGIYQEDSVRATKTSDRGGSANAALGPVGGVVPTPLAIVPKLR